MMPGLLSLLRSPPLLCVKEVVLVGGLTGVHVQRGPVGSTAGPTDTPHLPVLPRDDVEEILFLNQLRHRHELAVVGVTLEQCSVPNAPIRRTQNLWFILNTEKLEICSILSHCQ